MKKKCPKHKLENPSTSKFSCDHLNEVEFENFCYDLLGDMGFINLNWRKGTGLHSSPADRGRDIECFIEKTDIDGTKYFERWLVECKHQKKGIPVEGIQGILTWSQAEIPDVVLIIASNFLSNNTKDFLEKYEKDTDKDVYLYISKLYKNVKVDTKRMEVKLLLVSRTVADLYDSVQIKKNHINQAIELMGLNQSYFKDF